MLDFAIFAISFVIFLLLLVFYLYPGSSSKKTNVPGIDPSDVAEGNIADILQAGGLDPFLKDLHERFGPVASFWMGSTLVVTVATPELLKEHQQIFNKPEELFTMFSSLVGNHTLLNLNGVEGRKRREIWQEFLQLDSLLIPAIEFSEDLSSRLSSLPKGQHVPLQSYTRALCMKICCRLAFGDFFQDEQVLKFSRIFKTCLLELESQMAGSNPEKGSPRLQRFQEEVDSLKSAVRHAIDQKSSGKTFLSALLEAGLSQEEAVNDSLLFLVKFNSLSSAMAWMLYFVASDESVQMKLHKESQEVLKEKPDIKENLSKLGYTQQVVNESLRLASVEPWTARVQDLDVEIGGFIIPKKTPVILALGFVLQSGKYWALPQNFNPDNFSSKELPAAFQPFGPGKRGCPAQTFASNLMQALLSSFSAKLKLSLVDGQVATPLYGICTLPEDEVWVTLEKR